MLNKIPVIVPKGIRYLSDWEDFKLSNFPDKCIINKQLPGCGFTEYSLTSEDENNVVCSPRKTLIENKFNQHPDTVYLVVNDYEQEECIDADMSKPKSEKTSSKSTEENDTDKYLVEKNYFTFFEKLKVEIGAYMLHMDYLNLPYKIEVTYDSFRILKDVLVALGVFNKFYVIVDEYQSILDDCRFKPDTEIEFLDTLSTIPKTLFVSATPMLDSSTSKIDEFKDLPYFEFDWKSENPSRIKKPDLRVRTMRSVRQKAGEIIQEYLEGKFEKAIVERDGELVEVESKEAVLFMNNVNHIINTIKKTDLQPDQVNILCARNNKNLKAIQRKLGKKFTIGTVPLKGEQHKMFTFCTRTVYLGADFYSLCARSFIFSDANSDCLSIDISMDLPQILGRQRLTENPWKNSAYFYYIYTRDWRKIPKEKFDEIIKNKVERTKNLLSIYEKGTKEERESLAAKYLSELKLNKYRDDYVAVNCHIGNSLVPKMNNLVLVNDQRAFDIQQIDYADRFSVFCKMRDELDLNSGFEISEVNNFFFEYDKLTKYVDKIKYLCEFSQTHSKNAVNAVINNLVDSDKIKQQFLILGPEKIMATGYNLTLINKAIGLKTFDRGKLDGKIIAAFSTGDRFSKKILKETLLSIYQEVGYSVKPKASDLGEWFDISLTKITIENGKTENGFKINSVKSKYENLYKLIKKK